MRFHRSSTLTCQELVELVTEYVEGALPAPQRRGFEAHVAHCSGCATYLHQLQVLIQLLGEIEPHSLSVQPRPDLRDALAEWNRSSHRS